MKPITLLRLAIQKLTGKQLMTKITINFFHQIL